MQTTKKSVKQIGSKVYKICGIIREEFSLNGDLQKCKIVLKNWKSLSKFNFSKMLTKAWTRNHQMSEFHCQLQEPTTTEIVQLESEQKKDSLKMHVFSILHLRFCIMLPFQMNFECCSGPSYSPFDLKSK